MPYVPTVRGDIALITAGRRGTDEDTFTTAGAILLDAALAGVIALDGKRVVAGPADPPDALMADVRRRVEAAKPDKAFGWCERVAVFGEDALAAELEAAGLARPLKVPFWKSVLQSAFRHRTLEVLDAAEAVRAADRLRAVETPQAVAAVAALHESELLGLDFDRRERKRMVKGLDDRVRALPPAAQAVVAALRERRERDDRVSHYAD